MSNIATSSEECAACLELKSWNSAHSPHTCALQRRRSRSRAALVTKIRHLRRETKTGVSRAGFVLSKDEKSDKRQALALLEKELEDDMPKERKFEGPDMEKLEQAFARPADETIKEIDERLRHKLTDKERAILDSFDCPQAIQDWLHQQIAYTYRVHPQPVCVTLKTKKAHCFGSALVAYYAMTMQGYECAMLGWNAVNDDAHAVCAFRVGTKGNYMYGALGKSSISVLKMRPAMYHSLRELVMSYVPFHLNARGEATMIEWSPMNLWQHCKWDKWIMGKENLKYLDDMWNEFTQYRILEEQLDPRREGVKQPTKCKNGRVLLIADSDSPGMGTENQEAKKAKKAEKAKTPKKCKKTKTSENADKAAKKVQGKKMTKGLAKKTKTKRAS